MLFERRTYLLRAGAAEEFWHLQRVWNTPRGYRSILERCIGYFESIWPKADVITHLYRYDSFVDWEQRLQQSYSPDRDKYYSTARALVLNQENGFLSVAPSEKLATHWGFGRDWLPGEALYSTTEPTEKFCVVEEVLDFRPGGLQQFWTRAIESGMPETERYGGRLIGTFSSRVGRLNRAIQYVWFKNDASAAHYIGGYGLANTRWSSSLVELFQDRQVNLLRPSPVTWMRPLFEAVDWGAG
jgi:hypothetical protein